MDAVAQSQPHSYRIQALLGLVSNGTIRIPDFQRAFRWESRDVLALFDSILKGYPIGSVLLWKRDAPPAKLTIGALNVNAAARGDALWVVDGQQRITSLVNGVSPGSFARDERFRLVYDIDGRKFARPTEVRGRDAIPLPDLFDFERLLAWLGDRPDLQPRASELSAVAARLRDFELPASTVEQADESILRDIFDRMNNAGKRLKRAEIFDAIHLSTSSLSDQELSIGAIADRVADATTFGRVDDDTVLQVILARRHPDVSRDLHGEFGTEREAYSDFKNEDRDAAYGSAERALVASVAFLTSIGVPHITMLPYRFLLVVIARFFSHFPVPHPRNRELLSRWFWQAASAGSSLAFSGSTQAVRGLAGRVSPGDENGSVQALLEALGVAGAVPLPDVRKFRTNQAASKIILCAMWSRGPRRFVDGEEIEPTELALNLEGEESPLSAVIELLPRRKIAEPSLRASAANRVFVGAEEDFSMVRDRIVDLGSRVLLSEPEVETLGSQFFEAEVARAFSLGEVSAFLESREQMIAAQVASFLELKTGQGFDLTPPLDSLDFDEEE